MDGADTHSRTEVKNILWVLLAAWVVGGALAYAFGPLPVSKLAGISADFGIGARASLVVSWVMFVLFVAGAANLVLVLCGCDERLNVWVSTPFAWPETSALVSWLIGILAFIVGCLIGTTVFS